MTDQSPDLQNLLWILMTLLPYILSMLLIATGAVVVLTKGKVVGFVSVLIGLAVALARSVMPSPEQNGSAALGLVLLTAIAFIAWLTCARFVMLSRAE